MVNREIRVLIDQAFDARKAVLLIGARQVGKTTLLMDIASKYPKALFFDCDEPDIRKLFSDPTSTQLTALFGDASIVIIDEAQRVKNIGVTLKLITDKIKNVKLLVSGSSALDLTSGLNETLTGRKVEIIMAGFSTAEMVAHHGLLIEQRLLSQRLIYGMYPEIVMRPDRAESQLNELTTGYMYKDLFNYQDIRKPEILPNLLEALARQLGSEVSYNELAGLLGSDPDTIKRYINLLEKTMVIFKLRSFARNLRNELKKSRKVYFYDNGIRNAIIGDFRSMELRPDSGALWENFMVSERHKYNVANKNYAKRYFWRTTQQQEIDYIEEYNDEISAYEFKFNANKLPKFTITFTDAYHPSTMKVVNSENYMEFLLR